MTAKKKKNYINSDMPLKVFVSYSYDSQEHKEWVQGLVLRLRSDGFDATTDVFDLHSGMDLPLYMETKVQESDKVIIVCTSKYFSRATQRKGGVGYESMIITAELAKNLTTKKFIPVLREKTSVPIYLGSKHYADFCDDELFEDSVSELEMSLCEKPLCYKPPIGSLPSRIVHEPSAQHLDSSEYLNHIEAGNISNILKSAKNTIRTKNKKEWSEENNILKGIITQIPRESLNIQSKESLKAYCDETINLVAPILIHSFAGIHSDETIFFDQNFWIREFLNPSECEDDLIFPTRSQREFVLFVYQAVGGSIATSSNNSFKTHYESLRKKYNVPHENDTTQILENSRIIGFPDLLGHDCINAWEYITSRYEIWSWLKSFFIHRNDYLKQLSAYYTLLDIGYEIEKLFSPKKKNVYLSNFDNMPPVLQQFLDNRINQNAAALIVDNQLLEVLLGIYNISKGDFIEMYPNIVTNISNFASALSKGRFFRFGSSGLPHNIVFQLVCDEWKI